MLIHVSDFILLLIPFLSDVAAHNLLLLLDQIAIGQKALHFNNSGFYQLKDICK